MNYEYNGNLEEDERISQVTKEITLKYPFISLDNAIKASTLEGKIDKEVSITDKLNRLYNIMLVNSNNKDIVMIIFKDYLELLKNNNIDNKYYYLSQSINEYLYNYSDFPIISEF